MTHSFPSRRSAVLGRLLDLALGGALVAVSAADAVLVCASMVNTKDVGFDLRGHNASNRRWSENRSLRTNEKEGDMFKHARGRALLLRHAYRSLSRV